MVSWGCTDVLIWLYASGGDDGSDAGERRKQVADELH